MELESLLNIQDSELFKAISSKIVEILDYASHSDYLITVIAVYVIYKIFRKFF